MIGSAEWLIGPVQLMIASGVGVCEHVRACVCMCMCACEGGGSGLYAYGSRAVNDMPALLRSDAPEMNAFGFQFFCQKRTPNFGALPLVWTG